jgi:hypothetical protein
MNNYVIFVNGALIGPDPKIKIGAGVSVVHGAYVEAVFPKTWNAPGRSGEIRSVDIFEYRSGNCTRRYRHAMDEDVKREHVKDDEYSVSFRCLSVPNAF